MKKQDKYAFALTVAVALLVITAFLHGFGKFCYNKGFADAKELQNVVKQLKPLSKYIK